jgi:hypothetical protein
MPKQASIVLTFPHQLHHVKSVTLVEVVIAFPDCLHFTPALPLDPLNPLLFLRPVLLD